MRKTLFHYLIVGILIISASCKKSSSPAPNPAPTPEANLNISISPDPGATNAISFAASYSYKLLINSTPPTNGVKVDITVTNDLDNSVTFSQSIQTNSASTTSVDLQISNLNLGALYTVKTDVTSLTTPTNKASKNFKITRK